MISLFERQPTPMVSLLDLKPPASDFLGDVLSGLRQSPKTLPCKYFYDHRGSQIFDKICDLEEYYQTRTEASILQQQGTDITAQIGAKAWVVEFGSGSSLKTKILLDQLDNPAGYVPIDISREHLLDAATRLNARYPEMPVLPVCADYTLPMRLPTSVQPRSNIVVFFPGSTIGNFTPSEAKQFLRRIAKMCGHGRLLIGVDLKKPTELLEAAYNDKDGVTADFNLNLLHRINQELDGDFMTEAFSHRAIYDHTHGRIEMHLFSDASQEAEVNGQRFQFASGESILTEFSYKYTVPEFEALAQHAGYALERVWTDPNAWFSLQMYRF